MPGLPFSLESVLASLTRTLHEGLSTVPDSESTIIKRDSTSQHDSDSATKICYCLQLN